LPTRRSPDLAHAVARRASRALARRAVSQLLPQCLSGGSPRVLARRSAGRGRRGHPRAARAHRRCAPDGRGAAARLRPTDNDRVLVMYTLGINAAFHDSAACLVRDGHVVAAAEEERFSRIKHGKRPVPFSTWELPFAAIEWCLRTADIGLGDVDRVAYSFDPEPLLRALPQRDVLTLPLEPSAAPVDERWLTAWEPLFAASIVNAPRQLRGGAPHHLRAR